MHELSLVESVAELIEDTARGENFMRVKTVFMEIGRLSCLAPDALRCIRFCGASVGAHPLKVLRGMGMRIVELDVGSDDRHSLRFLFFRLLRQMRFVSIL